MQAITLNRHPAALLALPLALLVGASAAIEPSVALGLTGLVLIAVAFMAPTAAWVAAAISLVLVGRVPVVLGPVPEASVQLPIILAWVALMLALVRYRGGDTRALGLVLRLGLLIVTVFASTAAAGVELLRPMLSLSLLGTPFALLGALLLDPPSPYWRRFLVRLMIVLLAIQIPFVLAQVALFGISDFVRGTLVGSLGGAHQIAAICTSGALWLLLDRGSGPTKIALGGSASGRVALIVALAFVPIVAGANQVLVALPVALLALALVSRRRLGLVAVVLIASIVGLLAFPSDNAGYARRTFERVSESVKAEPATAIAQAMADDFGNFTFGQGPATTVSSAAFLTTESNNPLITQFGLGPAKLPSRLDSTSAPGSIQRPISSVLGITGDLGILGTLAYGALFAYVFGQVCRRATPLGQVTAASLAILLFLGYFNDWLEQPPYAMFVALLAGLALTEPVGSDEQRKRRSPGSSVSAASAPTSSQESR